MKTLIVIVAILLVAVWMHGGSYTATGYGPIAPTLAQCPPPTKGYWRMCPVGANGSYETYVSYNGGSYTATGW